MVKENETKEDRTGVTAGLIHYSVAKREGLKPGSMFQVDDPCCKDSFFQIKDYIDWDPSRNCRFSGFRFVEL
jgi:hypothetical protein